MQAVMRWAGVAPEMNLKNPLPTGEKRCGPGIYPGLETQDTCHQKSGISCSQKGLMSYKNILTK